MPSLGPGVFDGNLYADEGIEETGLVEDDSLVLGANQMDNARQQGMRQLTESLPSGQLGASSEQLVNPLQAGKTDDGANSVSDEDGVQTSFGDLTNFDNDDEALIQGLTLSRPSPVSAEECDAHTPIKAMKRNK